MLLAAPTVNFGGTNRSDADRDGKTIRDDDLDDDGDSGVNNAKDNKLRVIDEEEKRTEEEEEEKVIRDVLYALDDSDDERE